MSVTTARTNKSIILLLVLFPTFSGSALAQMEALNKYSLVAEADCRTNGCTADGESLSLQIRELWKPDVAALADTSSSFRFSFYMKSEPGTGQNMGSRFIEHVADTPADGNPVLPIKLDERGESPVPSDLLWSEKRSLGAKLLRASVLTHTAQISNLMFMIAFPDSFNYSCSSWSEAKSNLHRAWTSSPVWDKDPWTTNFIAHPYAGSVYYNMLRSQGASLRASFLYSTGQSLLWEFVIEAVAEQPSIQDLIFTSNLGSILGEFSHRATLRMRRNGFSTFEKILVSIINPGYVLNRGFNDRLGALETRR
jgi:hypothetical protein